MNKQTKPGKQNQIKDIEEWIDLKSNLKIFRKQE